MHDRTLERYTHNVAKTNLSLIEAQRNLILLRDRRYEAIADYFRRRATLERVIGGSLIFNAEPSSSSIDSPPRTAN
jgi:hypothetical protein